MKEIVRVNIEKIYKDKDFDFFKSQCLKELKLPSEFNKLFCNKKIKVEEGYSKSNPSKTWYIKYPPYIKGEFNVLYKTLLSVSKIAPLYYIQHEFEVENVDEDRMQPTLDGFSGQPYTKTQATYHKNIVEILEKAGFLELSYAEMNEVLSGLSFKYEPTIFGSQVTVEYALFHDIWELCPDQE